MCGRTACTLDSDQIVKACTCGPNRRFQGTPTWQNPLGGGSYKPSYNVAPTTYNPILLPDHHFSSHESNQLVIQPMHWGLIPSFHKGDPKSFTYSTINARSDGLMDKNTYKVPLQKGQRCVVLADGKGKKSSTLGQYPLYSYTIITVDASKKLSWMHDRMPALLDTDEAMDKWLDSENVSLNEALKLLKPVENVEYHAVSPTVGNVRNQGSECIVPMKEEKGASSSGGGGQPTLFKYFKPKMPKLE